MEKKKKEKILGGTQ